MVDYMQELKEKSLIMQKELSYYRTEGVVNKVYYPKSVDEFMFLLEKLKDYYIIGAGANTLFGSAAVKTPLISTTHFRELNVDGNQITASAGVTLNELVILAIENGLGGIEKMSGIPGSVGGAVWMNAGAYGQEISDCLEQVTVIEDGEIKELTKGECGFSYRQAKRLANVVILEAIFSFQSVVKSELETTRREILTQRALKQPLEFASCGSVFKRPTGDYASRLIDATGLKGVSVGDAEVSTKHAGFIINRGHATSNDILELISFCKTAVSSKFGVELELEQQLVY